MRLGGVKGSPPPCGVPRYNALKRRKMFFRLRYLLCATLVTPLFWGGCTLNHNHHMHAQGETISSEAKVSPPFEKQVSLGLDQSALEAHRAVMQDHFKAVHEIVAALAEGQFELAQNLTETRLGFSKHREAMRKQKPEIFPPAYHDFAMAHHQAAEDLAKVISSKNLNRILPHLERTLKACVQCHENFKR